MQIIAFIHKMSDSNLLVFFCERDTRSSLKMQMNFFSSKNQEDRHLLFLDIFSISRVTTVQRRVVSQQKMLKKAIEINQNQ